LNAEVYSSFASVYINPVIYSRLINVGLGSVNCEIVIYVAWLLINIARVGVKAGVDLEKLFYENLNSKLNYDILNSLFERY
jgi:hypothetical protein